MRALSARVILEKISVQEIGTVKRAKARAPERGVHAASSFVL